MKELYLRILNQHKKKMIFFFSLLFLLGGGVQFQTNYSNLASLFTIFLACIYCLYAWLNGTFTFAAPLDENSSGSDVFWRWVMIFMSFLLFIYAFLAPIYKL
ncbi:hypothetical protein [Acinetobacter colistiniresistens]|uniref:hypothetical protein n=1 Tax=Acinetobacter colistiniresistens TaxID=280145 RepID=UPI00124FA7E4|nr:hypothetical protein [Acinetobacter colistiniresistens]